MRKKRIYRKLLTLLLGFAFVFNLAAGVMAAEGGLAPAGNIHVINSEKIASGVSYTEEDISNYYDTGNRVRVNRLDINPSAPYTEIISGKALETVNAMETVANQAQREILKGNQVVAGINADMFDTNTGMPIGLMVKGGELITSQGPDETGDFHRTSFYIEHNNIPGIDSLRLEGSISVGESVYDVNLLNRNQNVSDALVINTASITKNHKMTHFYAGSKGNSAFALIRVDQFAGVYPGQEYTGSVENVYMEDGFNIPEGYIVLAGYGTKKAEVESSSPGELISFRFDLYAGSVQNNNIANSIAFNTWLVRDGHALDASEMPDKTSFTTGPNARTALGIKADGSLVVVTVDKPSASFGQSIGTSLPDLAQYMLDAGCINALNLDGGGSTEMIVRRAGTEQPITVNHPSDGSSRAVTNSLLFVSSAAKSGVVGNVVVDKNVALYKGSSYNFTYRVTDEYGNSIKIVDTTGQWKANLGTIDENGRYTTPNEKGSDEVTATVNGIQGKAAVNVVDDFASIDFTATSSVVMQQNETKQFEFNAVDASGNQIVVDPSLAEWSLTGDIGQVSEKGLVTATANYGTGTLTASIAGKTVTAVISVGLKEQVIDDFETYPIEGYHLGGYGYGNVAQYAGSAGSSNYLSISSDIKHSGTHSFKMDYDFTSWTRQYNGTLNWIPHWYTGSKWPDELAAQMDTTYKTEVYPKKFGLWVYGDGKAPWLRAIFKDGSGTNKTIDLTSDHDDVNWVGWKYIEVDIPQGWELPIRLNYLYSVETDKAKPTYSGTIYFDDLKFLYTDEATDFSGPEFTGITPSANNLYSSTLDFSAVITDKLSGVDADRITVKVNGVNQNYTFDPNTGRLGFKLENLSEGDYNVFVEAYDLVSNQSVPWIDKTYHVDLSPDTVAPTISDVSPTSKVTVKIPVPRITFNIQDEKTKVAAVDIVVKLNDTLLPVYYDEKTGWGYAEPESELPDGSYHLTIDAKDRAGNAMQSYTDQLTIASISQPADHQNFNISVIPDTQGNAFTERIFKRAAADDASLVMHLGDIVDDGSEEQYEDAARYAQLFGTKPLFVLAGNHEAFKNTLDIFYTKFGSPTMHFDYGNTLIIMLNSAYGQSISASDSTQLHYLEEVLAKNRKSNVLVFNHVTTRDDFGTAHEMNPADAAKFESILSTYKKQHNDVDINVIFGHLHTLQSWEIDGVKYIIGGNAANKAYVGHGDGDLLGSGKITVTNGKMKYSFDPLLTKVYIKNDAVIANKMKAVVGSQVQLDLFGDFREYPSQYVAKLNSHKYVAIDWKSSNEAAAAVDENGVVSSKSAGTATITATSGGKSNSITVETVSPTEVKPVKLELSVPASIRVGDVVIPTVKATDAYGSVYALDLRDVSFAFKNGLVSRTSEGKLRGQAVGEEEVTAQFGGLQATAKVTVVAKPSSSSGSGGSGGKGNIPVPVKTDTDKAGADQTIDITSDTQVSGTIFAELGKTKGRTITFKGSDYEWIVRAEDITNPAIGDLFDLGVKLEKQNLVGKIAPPVQVNPDKVVLGLALNHHGEMPGKMMLKVNAGSASIGQTLYLYALNSAEEAPFLLHQLTADENGQVAIPFTSSSAAEYILTTQKIIVFNDADHHWAKDYIYYLASKNIITGVSENQFLPNQAITRAEFVKIVAGVAGADVSAYTDSRFRDVKSTDWFAPYIAWANEKGIVTGISSDSFAPNATITREQMAVILVRLSDTLGYLLNAQAAPVQFKDEAQISPYAIKAVKTAQQAGLVNGLANQRFAPAQSATRGEAAKMLTNLLKAAEAQK